MRIELAPALILHRRPWRDTSLLVEAFSREHGRIGLVAKGARRPKARLRGLIEPLAALDLSWTGRGELYTLIGAEPGQRYVLAGNALMAGLYASELTMRLTARDDPHPALYDSLAALLGALGDGAPAIVALRFFERDLLAEIGYGVPLIATTDTGEAIEAGRGYRYHPDNGLYAGVGPALAGETAVSGDTLIGLVAGRFAKREHVVEARALMRAAIAAQLGDRPLKSMQTLHAMQQFSAGGRSPPADSSTGNPS